MQIVVCLKQIPDLQQIRIKRDTREPVLEGVPLLLGDMDKNALEEAVRIVEQRGGKVTALALGSPKLRDTIKEALAMGADEALLLIDPAFADSDTMTTAKILAKAIEKREYDLILCGEGSTDNYSGQVPSRLAEILGLPQVTYVRQLEFTEGGLRATRDMEEALEIVEVSLPALVSVTSEINEPRLPSLIQILKAAKKPLQEWTSEDLAFSAHEVGKEASSLEVISNLAPEQERKNITLEGEVDEVVEQLTDAFTREAVIAR
ncbi:MAG: electron transfer flavoprotein subunit beta/FixA family protein [Anaerolineae bacterium]